MIQLFRPDIGEAEIQAVSEVLRSKWLGLGPKTEEFEKEFACYIGVPYAVALNSATAALDLSLRLLDVGERDAVLVPPITFVSTAHAVMYNGAIPVFVDVDEKTMSMDPKCAETALDEISNKYPIRATPKALIVVHYGGRPVNLEPFKKLGLPIVEDAAHACGASRHDEKCGSMGNLGCFSFHAVKNLAAGDGGMLTLHSQEMCERAKRLRWLGIDKTTWDRTYNGKSYWWQYKVDELGMKCHMNDITAALALGQLKRLDGMNARRTEIAKRYSDVFEDEDWIIATPLGDTEEIKSSWHLYWLRVPRRDELGLFLKDKGIITGVHYKPIHLHECYGPLKPQMPVAERVSQELISLPMHSLLSDADVDEVIGRVLEFGREHL